MKSTILTTDKYPYTVAFSPILKSILRRSAMGALTVRDNPMFDPSKSFKLPRGTEPLREFRERPNEAKRKSRMYPRVFVYIDAILALFTLALFRLALFRPAFPPPSYFPHSPIPPLFPCFLRTTGILQQFFLLFQFGQNQAIIVTHGFLGSRYDLAHVCDCTRPLQRYGPSPSVGLSTLLPACAWGA